MATRRTYSKWALAAIVGGVALTTIEVIGAVGHLVSQNQPSYLVAGGASRDDCGGRAPHPCWALLAVWALVARHLSLGGNGPSAERHLHGCGRANRRCARWGKSGPLGYRSADRAD